MKILIIEDERPAAERLINLVKSYNNNIEILGVLETIEESVNWLTCNKLPDLILMDIQLDDGLCFEIFETIDLQIPIIFTTAFDKYTLQAFKVNSIDYLLKPIKADDLEQALKKYSKTNKQVLNIETKIAQLIQNVNKSYRNRFLIKVGTSYKAISINNISYFFVQDKGTYLQTHKSRTFAIDYSLDQIISMLNPELFYRINRSCLVNINYINQLNSYSSSRLQLTIENEDKNELFVVSRDKVSDFKQWIDR